MAPSKDKWIRRFIITETKRHKKGFTIYKVTSMVFLKASHEEVSKVSVWKRYNDFKKLHSELSILHKRLDIKESFPTFSKSKYFGRFEAEVVEERKKHALKFLEFVGRYSHLYTNDIFITFFETSHLDRSSNCAYSSSPTRSDTSEEDRIVTRNDPLIINDNETAHGIFQTLCPPKMSRDVSTNPRSIAPNDTNNANENEFTEPRTNESYATINLHNAIVSKTDEESNKMTRLYVQSTVSDNCNVQNVRNKNLNKNATTLSNESGFDSLNNNNNNNNADDDNVSKNLFNYNTDHSTYSTHALQEFLQVQSDPMQYLLIAAAHMSAAFKHESIAEYEEAFMQYKLGISCLINGVQFDPNGARIVSIKDKISKYLAQAEQLYNRYLNCNISLVNKPVSELQYYKVLKVMKSVMLVMDVRANRDRIMKPVEKSSIQENNISDYVLKGQVPYMVRLYACVETETTVFLILQYASYGRLWDFVRLHYRTSDSPSYINMISNHIYTDKRANGILKSDEMNGDDTTKLKRNDKIIKDNELQSRTRPTDVYNQIGGASEMPTMQLLENSQKLLQSVNATLRRSNSIASRLNVSDESKRSGNAASLSIQTPRELNLAPFGSMDNIINENLSKQNFGGNEISKNSMFKVNSLFSVNKNKDHDRTESDCASALKGDHDSPVRNKVREHLQAIDNSAAKKTASTRSVSSGEDAARVIHGTNDAKNISDGFSNINCDGDETVRYPCRENDIEEEPELWRIPEAVIRTWAAEILLALEALHRQNVLYRDFNPDNVLLDEAGHVRLTYIIPQRSVQLSRLMHPYSSPESASFSPTVAITFATDVWSVGVILYELLTGTTFVVRHPGPFHSHSALDIPSNLSGDARSLLCGMLKYYPNERLTIDEIKRHSFFTKIDWSSMVDSPT